MDKHGPYSGVAGYFDDSQEPADDKSKNLPNAVGSPGTRGIRWVGDEDGFREKGALPDLSRPHSR